MSLSSSSFIRVRRKLRKLISPIGNVTFVLTLLWIPYLSFFKNETSVEEHGYLNKYSVNELVNDDFTLLKNIREKLMIIDSSDDVGNDVYINDSYSEFYINAPLVYPEILKRSGELIKDNIDGIELLYNRFGYIYDKDGINRSVNGNYIVCRLRCKRCASRGSILLISTFKNKNDITSISLGICILKHLNSAEYLLQDIIYLIVDSNVPYGTCTRQFLLDYYNNENYPLRSHLIHNAIVIDLGHNNCNNYMLSYEGIDGLIPNQDIINMFIKISNSEGLNIITRSIWNSIFRIALNVDNNKNHIPLLSKSINSFSIICTRGKEKGDINDENKLNLLYKSLTLAIRNQNNLDTVLERSYNFYFLIDPNHFISISLYIPIIPLLLLKPMLLLFFSTYVNQFTIILLGITIFIINTLLGTIPSYIYLLRIIKKYKTINSNTLIEIRHAIILLTSSYLILLLINLTFFKLYKNLFNQDNAFDFNSDDDNENEVLVKHDLISQYYKFKKSTRTSSVSEPLCTVGSTSASPSIRHKTLGHTAFGSPNLLSVTPGDRGGSKGNEDVTSSGLPVADLREAKGQLRRESCLQDNERTSAGSSKNNLLEKEKIISRTSCKTEGPTVHNSESSRYTNINNTGVFYPYSPNNDVADLREAKGEVDKESDTKTYNGTHSGKEEDIASSGIASLEVGEDGFKKGSGWLDSIKYMFMRSDLYNDKFKLLCGIDEDESSTMITPSSVNDNKETCSIKEKLDSMGSSSIIYPLPKNNPPIDVILSISTLIISICFMMSLSIMNWPLAFLLILIFIIPLRLLRISKRVLIIRPLITLLYIVILILLLYPFKSSYLQYIRNNTFYCLSFICGLINNMLNHKIFKSYNKYVQPLCILFQFLEKSVFGNHIHWINTTGIPLLLTKLFTLTEDHIFYGSYTLPIILFYAVPTLFHCILINICILYRLFKSNN